MATRCAHYLRRRMAISSNTKSMKDQPGIPTPSCKLIASPTPQQHSGCHVGVIVLLLACDSSFLSAALLARNLVLANQTCVPIPGVGFMLPQSDFADTRTASVSEPLPSTRLFDDSVNVIVLIAHWFMHTAGNLAYTTDIGAKAVDSCSFRIIEQKRVRNVTYAAGNHTSETGQQGIARRPTIT